MRRLQEQLLPGPLSDRVHLQEEFDFTTQPDSHHSQFSPLLFSPFLSLLLSLSLLSFSSFPLLSFSFPLLSLSSSTLSSLLSLLLSSPSSLSFLILCINFPSSLLLLTRRTDYTHHSSCVYTPRTCGSPHVHVLQQLLCVRTWQKSWRLNYTGGAFLKTEKTRGHTEDGDTVRERKSFPRPYLSYLSLFGVWLCPLGRLCSWM